MNDDEISLAVSLPLDSDGFLRRECPTCERELKWLPDEGSDDEYGAVPDAGYFCPYCAVQAPSDSWFTQAQLELIESHVSQEVVGPMLDDFSRDLRNIGRRTGGMLSFDATFQRPDYVDPLTEPDDMRRVEFTCHPDEPVKVADEWSKPVHCLICGSPAS